MPSQLFRKPLLAPGVHHSPNGTLTLTPERARRYVDKFHQLKAEGVRFPIPWAHHLAAMPNNIDFAKSRYNASYIEDLESDASGNLFVVAPPPPGWTICPDTGDLINPREGTRIGEVSGGFGNWRDGKNRRHRDIVLHAALCTLPVWPGQGGFEWADGPKTLSSAVEYTFLGSSRGVLNMAKDDKDEKEPKELEEDAENPISGSDEEEYTPEPEESAEAPLPEEAAAPAPAAPVTPGVDDMEQVKQLTQIYAEMNLPLPPAPDVKTFLNNLLVALTVARGVGMKFQKASDENPNEQQDRPPALGSSADQPPQPEHPPIMMSTAELALREKETGRMRKDVERVWSQNKRLGVPVHICDREASKGSTIALSTTKGGKIRTPEVLRTARLVREVMQATKGVPSERQKNLATSAVETSPLAKAADANKLDPGLYNAMIVAACTEAGATVPKHALEPSKN